MHVLVWTWVSRVLFAGLRSVLGLMFDPPTPVGSLSAGGTASKCWPVWWVQVDWRDIV